MLHMVWTTSVNPSLAAACRAHSPVSCTTHTHLTILTGGGDDDDDDDDKENEKRKNNSDDDNDHNNGDDEVISTTKQLNLDPKK